MVAGEGSVRPWESHRGDVRLADQGTLERYHTAGAKTRRAQMSKVAERVRDLDQSHTREPKQHLW